MKPILEMAVTVLALTCVILIFAVWDRFFLILPHLTLILGFIIGYREKSK